MDFVEEMNTWQEIPLLGSAEQSGLIDIDAEFPDRDGLLETAYAFLRRLKSLPVRVVTRQTVTSVFEEYVFETRPGVCIISANDTEGIRRGVYHVADVLRQYVPADLPVRIETVTPRLRLRFCRYSFGSAKHPSSYEEFIKGFDSCPEPFLERIASEGANVLWFTALHLAKICLNGWVSADAEAKRERYERIQQAVDRCRKYGIRLFAYMVIPFPLTYGDPLAENHPSLVGPNLYTYRLFCMAYEGKKFLYDCMRQLFTSVRNLGGVLAIVQGEGAAFCPDILECGGRLCNEQCKMTPADVYVAGLASLFEGMRSAQPDADFVAWFYLPFAEKVPTFLGELVARAPKEIIYQCNVESGAQPVQLGKVRPIGDYWQAFSGTAPVFDEFASVVRRNGGQLGAKIQVGTSHEVGSVPYVPVPALTYRKYAALQTLGVSMVMQGWKTGGTPGLMNIAAGRLAFTDCEKVSEAEFLSGLAVTQWGPDAAEEAVRGWKLLSEAYTHYPYSNMIQYFGPVADGVNWPLYVQMAEKPLLPTWGMNGGKISGDTLWECLDNHTFEEAVQLFGELAALWHQGTEVFRGIASRKTLNRQQSLELGRIEALEILFGTAERIFSFYRLRRRYLNGDKNALATMRTIALEERAERRRLLPILDADPVIGYNPEAHGNKFDRVSIEKGLAALEQTLADLDEAERQPVPPPLCHGTAILDGRVYDQVNLSWTGLMEDGRLKISVKCPGHFKSCDELFIAFDDKGERGPVWGHFDHFGHIFVFPVGCECRIHSEEDGWGADMVFPADALPGGNPEHCRCNITRLMDDYEHRCSWPGAVSDFIVARLNLAFYDSRDMGDLRLP